MKLINLGKKNVLGILVNAIDYEAATHLIINAAINGQRLAASALAVHGVMTGVLDTEHKYRLNSLDLVVPDGQPVRWALNWLSSSDLTDRVYGPQLTLLLCKEAAERGLPVFFYGSHSEVLTLLSANLQTIYPDLKIAGMRPSLFRTTSENEKLEIVNIIKQSGARMVFVGLGCPRQEVWAFEYRDFLEMPLIAVGAAFDFHAKSIAQAHPNIQKYGFEWLFRLVQEPSRLWKRYLLLNPLYLFYLTLQLLKLKFFDPSQAKKPVNTINYG